MSNPTEGWVTVVPEPGKVKEAVTLLLAAAEFPEHVLSQRNGTEFLVPPYVADAYNAPAAAVPKRRARKIKED